jgi:hypothetical protein
MASMKGTKRGRPRAGSTAPQMPRAGMRTAKKIVTTNRVATRLAAAIWSISSMLA